MTYNVTSDNLSKLSIGLGFLNSYNNARMAKSEGKINRMFGEIEADQLLRNATLRMNQGVSEAEQERFKGEVVQSNAISQMAASGGGIDPLMLALMKTRSDYNSMSAIYDAKRGASELRMAAYSARAGAKMTEARGAVKSQDIMTGAFASALGDWPRISRSTTRPGYGRPPLRGPHS